MFNQSEENGKSRTSKIRSRGKSTIKDMSTHDLINYLRNKFPDVVVKDVDYAFSDGQFVTNEYGERYEGKSDGELN